jgi:type IV pilus assembly protein PilE
MRTAKGFTLIEILVTVAIVGIITAIALPAYKDYVTRSKLVEAYSMLAGQRVKMEQYYQDLRTYLGACVAGTVAPPIVAGNFTYACALADQSYTITATGVAAQGTTGFTFTIDQSNIRTSAGPAAWGASTTCWIRNKNSIC